MREDLVNWQVTIEGVTAEDMKALAKKAGSVGLSIGSLLGNFINDLVGGAATNGSDERMYARQWFDRCGFAMFPDENFLRYLVEWGGLEEVLEAWQGIPRCEAMIAETEKAIETGEMVAGDGHTYTWRELVTRDSEGEKPAYSSREEWEASERDYIEQEQEEIADYKETLSRWWEEYTEQATGEYSPGTLDEEMKMVVEWGEKHQQFLN